MSRSNRKSKKLKYCSCGKIGFAKLSGQILCLMCYRFHPKTKPKTTIPQLFYAAYIRSKKWREKRQYKLSKSGNKCEKCGRETKRPEVHHLNYKSLGNESIVDLQTLCHSCHMKIHNRRIEAYEPWGRLVGN